MRATPADVFRVQFGWLASRSASSGSADAVADHGVAMGSSRHAHLQLVLVGVLLAALIGGCGADLGGSGGVTNFPARVIMEGWDSISGGTCRAWLTNDGDRTATNVRVYLWYSTPQGDTMLVMQPTSTTIRPNAQVELVVPVQLTRGEARFPGFAGANWTENGGGDFVREPLPTKVSWPTVWCLQSPDSARARMYCVYGMAYHLVANVETASGTVQCRGEFPVIGSLLIPNAGRPINSAISYRNQNPFSAPARDSAGVKLNPRVLSITWENFAGVADSILPPYLPDSLRSCQ